jgi:hypothetical protein
MRSPSTLGSQTRHRGEAVRGVRRHAGVLGDYLERDTKPVDTPFPGTGTGGAASSRSSSRFTTAGPNGHDIDKTHRDCGYGSVYIHTHNPVNGTITNPQLPPLNSLDFPTSGENFRAAPIMGQPPRFHTGKLPKLHFPKFEGENSKLWKSRCENYFEMYEVDVNILVKVAMMHFEGPVTRWL